VWSDFPLGQTQGVCPEIMLNQELKCATAIEPNPIAL
jgi:hypothetical protein